MAVDELSVDHYAAAYAGAEGDHDEILQTAGCAVSHLADCSGVGIVGDGHGYAELVADHLGQGQGSGPGDIDEFFDHAGVVVGIGCAYAYAVDFVNSVIGHKQPGHFIVKLVKICVDIGMFQRLDGGTGDNYATCVDDAENCIGTAYVDTHYVRFAHCDIMWGIKGLKIYIYKLIEAQR